MEIGIFSAQVRPQSRSSRTAVQQALIETSKCPKTLETQLFRPIGTQCVMGVQSVRAKARRKLMYLSLRLAFYIRIELDRSNVDARSFQASTNKMLYFQGLYGF